MSIRWKNGRPIVEVYDPLTKGKKHVKARDYGMEVPKTERQAKDLERAALNARDACRPGSRTEMCGEFAKRWPDDYPRGRNGEERGESTVIHNRERVKAWGDAHEDIPLRSYGRAEARIWARDNPGTVSALRTMFYDAKGDGLVDECPFSSLGIEKRKGREDITVLTTEEIEELKSIAVVIHGKDIGGELAAMIDWGAYTMMRTGEVYASRYSLLNGDVYDVRRQFNSRLRRETDPKHNSKGLIYVPEPARSAVLEKPRRLNDDLMFRTQNGKQFRSGSLHYVWNSVRRTFAARLPEHHHLRQRIAISENDQLDFYELRHFGASYALNVLGVEPWVIAQQLRHKDDGTLVIKLYGHPEREVAIDRQRQAWTKAKVTSLRGIDGLPRIARGGNLGG